MGRRGVPAGMFEVARIGAALALALTLANCGKSDVDSKYGVAASRRVVEPGEAVPKGGGTYRVGKPYQVAGRTYVPEENPNYDAEGMASWYGVEFHGRQTANGEVFDMNSVSAAHPTLPIPSYVRVTNLRNQKSLIVRVNDRGPYHENRVIDVSVRSAKLLGFHQYGVTRVRVEFVGRAALEGSDDEKLAATLRNGAPAPGPGTMVASAKPSRPFLAEYFDPKPCRSAPASTLSRSSSVPRNRRFEWCAARPVPRRRPSAAPPPGLPLPPWPRVRSPRRRHAWPRPTQRPRSNPVLRPPPARCRRPLAASRSRPLRRVSTAC